jgi:hypothetical protein
MTHPRRITRALGAAGLIGAIVATSLGVAGASSHREAPLISEDPVADNTDLYAFVSPDAPDDLTVIANWIPLEEPASGPNFWKFGDDVLYEINIDNDGDARDDVVYEFRFQTTIPNPDTYLYNTAPIEVVTDGDGEAISYSNLNQVQTYTVTEVKDGKRRKLGSGLLTPPVNVGPRSTPNYAELAQAAVYELGSTGIEVFAGQRDEVFPVDLGSIFDLGGLRPLNDLHVIPLDPADGVNNTDGYNVHSIALQIPLDRIVEDDPVLGIYTTTWRRKTQVFSGGDGSRPVDSGPWVQVSRLGMPLVNEVVIPLGMKDEFNASAPKNDAQFLDSVVDPELGRLIPFLYPAVSNVPTAPRNDLVTIFLTGIPGLNQPANVVPSEMLRINTEAASGFPNGRTLADDVVDVELQAVAGIFYDPATQGFTLNSPFNVFPNNAITDGVSGNDVPFLDGFPYIPHPTSGYDS